MDATRRTGPPLYRGDGSDRPAGVALPPARMPLLHAGRLLKRWRYVSVWGSQISLCTGRVQVGPFHQEFWAIWDRAGRRLWEHTRLITGRVRLAPGMVHVRDGSTSIDVELDERGGFELITPDGKAYTWTRKQIVSARGSARVGKIRLPVEAVALIDDNAGYHRRHTRWHWSGGAGHDESGRQVAWSVITGLNDTLGCSENTLWIENQPHEVGPVRFADDLSSVAFADGAALHFHSEAVRARRDNLLLVRSNYRQPFGTWTGTLPGNIRLGDGYGVMEFHEAYW